MGGRRPPTSSDTPHHHPKAPVRVRRDPAVPLHRSLGETTVELDGRVTSLDPESALIVDFADQWVDLSWLVSTVTDVVDPDRARPGTDVHLRTRVLCLAA